MNALEHVVTDLALITATEQKLAAVKAERKAALAAELSRGTVYAYDGLGTDEDNQLGYATVPKPTQPKPVVSIDDESVVIPWAVEEFGDGVITTRLTEQGRTSIMEAAKAGTQIPGVTVTVPEKRPGTPRFVPSKRVAELVQGMVDRGVLDVRTVLELPLGGQQ